MMTTLVLPAQSLKKKYIKNSYYAGTSVKIPENISADEITELAVTVRPSARQLRWQQYGMLGFIHFNLNTFTGRQWGTGTEDLSIFNPEKLDASQWVTTFKKAGIKTVIIVAKHHDGFCLWPSSYRERSVKNTPWKNGKGDVIREFFDACRAEGIQVCIYYSPWDMQKPYGELTYNELMVNELTELLTNYGYVDLVWFDGAGIDSSVSGVEMDFDWPRIYGTIRKLQPQALISGAGPDIRWVGNESGKGRFTEWSVQGVLLPDADFSGHDSGVPLQANNLGDIDELKKFKQLTWLPARGGLPTRYEWFWRPEQHSRTLDYMVSSYFETVGQNSNLLVNLSPDNRGLVPDSDVVLMEKFGKYINSMFIHNYANGAVAKATAVHPGGYAANYLFDEDIRTCWLAPENATKGEITVKLYGMQQFNVIKLQENIADFGQRIETFEVDTWDGNAWKTIGKGTTIGFQRLLKVPTTKTDSLRIRITKSRKNPSMASLALYQAPEIIPAPTISRNSDGKIQIEGKSKSIRYTTNGTDPSKEAAMLYEGPFELPMGGRVRAIAISELDGFFTEESKDFGIDSKHWKIKGVANGTFIIDNDETTTITLNVKKKAKNHFVVELPEETTLSGFTYLPPQGTPDAFGRVESYTIYFMNKNGRWEEAHSGKFGNIDNNPVQRSVNFKHKIATKTIKFQVNSATRRKARAYLAEFNLLSL